MSAEKKKQNLKLSIVIPCYNEAENIPLLVDQVESIVAGHPIEVILVNNGSTDNSADVLEKSLVKAKNTRTHLVEVNQGYGFGIIEGLRTAKGDYLGYTHADLQTDPSDILIAFDILKKAGWPSNYYVKGNRKGRSFFDNIFTYGMSLFETVYMRTPLWDINGQPNIFHRSFFEKWQNPPLDFALDLYALYLASKENLNLVRFDVVFSERIYGESKWNSGLGAKWKFIKRTIHFSRALKQNLKNE